ncbi:InlB B-repeat-containing protein [Methanomassiliicoccales archaeon LGM-DZ1]|nr:InlB B-repeat-containing protein [Methanomassiliicoccales archaeon LGM-DZ1]
MARVQSQFAASAGLVMLALVMAAVGALIIADSGDDSDADAGTSPAICTVTINPGAHGTGSIIAWSVFSGNSIELPAAAFAPEDSEKYYLAGYAESSGGSAKYSAGQEIAVRSDMKLWAVWSEPDGMFDSNAPASGSASATWSYKPIDRTSYSGGNPGMWAAMAEILGYSTDLVVDSMPDWMTMTHSESWNEVEFKGSPTGPGVYLVRVHPEKHSDFSIFWAITVKASSDTAHRLTFDANGGTGSYSVAPGAEGTCTVLPSAGFAKTGYTLAAWSTKISGQTVYYPLSAAYTFTDHDAVMSAYYAPNEGVMVFDANGGVSSAGAQAYIVQSGGSVTLPSTGYTMPGHVLVGWRYSNEPSGAVYAPGYQLPVAAATPTNAMSAVWADASASLHKVTFSSNGGSDAGTGNSISVPAGTKVALPSVGFTKNGYTLHGWNTKADGSGDAYDRGASYTVGSADSTVYAVWSASQASEMHVVSFILNGGKGSIPSQSVPDGSTASKPNDPMMDGYVFKGWQQIGGSAGYFDFSKPIISDTYLRAIWQRAISVSVTGLAVSVALDANAPGTGYAAISWGDGSAQQTFYRTVTKTMAAGTSGDLTVTLSTGQKVSAHWEVSSGATGQFKVTVLDDGGKVLRTYTVSSGKELSKSSVMKDLAREGKSVTLYTDAAHEHEYGWGAVNGDLVLYAHYTDKGSSGTADTAAIAAAILCAVCIAGFAYFRNPSLLAAAIALGAVAAMIKVMI